MTLDPIALLLGGGGLPVMDQKCFHSQILAYLTLPTVYILVHSNEACGAGVGQLGCIGQAHQGEGEGHSACIDTAPASCAPICCLFSTFVL